MTNVTHLGSGIPPKSQQFDGALSVIDKLASDIETRVTREVMNTVRQALDARTNPAPVVNVAAPPAQLAPNVTVNAPVDIPDMGPITCTVELPGIDQLCTILTNLRDILTQPVTRTVQRNSSGTIESIIERRG